MVEIERRNRRNWRIDLNILFQTIALILVIGGYVVRVETRMAKFDELKIVVEKLTENQKVMAENMVRMTTIIEMLQSKIKK